MPRKKSTLRVPKESKTKLVEDMTFDEIVELAALQIHSALLEGGGREMKKTVYLWMGQAIAWGLAQD